MRRTLVLADIHAGRAGSRVGNPARLAPLFEGFDRIIFNGDCVEYCWQERERAIALTAELDACARDAAEEVVWIRGNHDLPIAGANTLVERGVLYTHGHGFAWDLRRREQEALPAEALFDRIAARYERVHCRRMRLPWLWNRLVLCATFLPAPRIGYARARATDIWGRIGRFIDLYADGPVRAVVTGHYHFAGVFRLPRREPEVRVYYTGAWMRNAEPHVAVVTDPDDDADVEVRLHRVRRHRGGWTLGAVCG